MLLSVVVLILHPQALCPGISHEPTRQRHSLEILDRITELVPPQKTTNVAAVLESIRSEYPSVSDFERDFPSLCFALATGVGKTRLMGAFISYLHLAHAINNFFVLAPNLTIYNKLITDFTPNTFKYVFNGIYVSINSQPAPSAPAPIFQQPAEQRVAQLIYETIRTLESQPQAVPSITYRQRPEVQARIVKEVSSQYWAGQLTLAGVAPAVDIAQVVATTTDLVVQQTIAIPRILVVPKGEDRPSSISAAIWPQTISARCCAFTSARSLI